MDVGVFVWPPNSQNAKTSQSRQTTYLNHAQAPNAPLKKTANYTDQIVNVDSSVGTIQHLSRVISVFGNSLIKCVQF